MEPGFPRGRANLLLSIIFAELNAENRYRTHSFHLHQIVYGNIRCYNLRQTQTLMLVWMRLYHSSHLTQGYTSTTAS